MILVGYFFALLAGAVGWQTIHGAVHGPQWMGAALTVGAVYVAAGFLACGIKEDK